MRTAPTTDRYTEATRSLSVRRAGDGLALRLAELDPATQAAALRLDPIADREEYAELAALTDSGEALTSSSSISSSTTAGRAAS